MANWYKTESQFAKLHISLFSHFLVEFLQQLCPNVAAPEFSEGALGSSGSVMCGRVSRFRPRVWTHSVSTPQQPRCFHQVRNQQVGLWTNSWDINGERSKRLMQGQRCWRPFCWEPISSFPVLGLAAPAQIRAWTTCFPPTALGVESAASNRNHCCSAAPARAPPIADCVPAELTFLHRTVVLRKLRGCCKGENVRGKKAKSVGEL